MRNNIYCNKFILKEDYVEDNNTGIRYVNINELESENGCRQVCDNVQRKLCEVLNHTDTITPVKILRCSDVDNFGDEKDNYKRKLK